MYDIALIKSFWKVDIFWNTVEVFERFFRCGSHSLNKLKQFYVIAFNGWWIGFTIISQWKFLPFWKHNHASIIFFKIFLFFFACSLFVYIRLCQSWAQFGGGHMGVICHVPPLFRFRFCIWRSFKNKCDICHVLCEVLCILDIIHS